MRAQESRRCFCVPGLWPATPRPRCARCFADASARLAQNRTPGRRENPAQSRASSHQGRVHHAQRRTSRAHVVPTASSSGQSISAPIRSSSAATAFSASGTSSTSLARTSARSPRSLPPAPRSSNLLLRPAHRCRRSLGQSLRCLPITESRRLPLLHYLRRRPRPKRTPERPFNTLFRRHRHHTQNTAGQPRAERHPQSRRPHHRRTRR